jgi:asparagine N-glycosylation enzyme membrane subunit Stt3
VLGAAVATASAYFICFVVRMIDCRRYIHFNAYIGRLVVNSILAVSAAAICYAGIKNGGICLFAIVVIAFLINLRAVTDTIKKVLKE